LNSRGLTVSWLDRLKSTLMGAAFELENENGGWNEKAIEDREKKMLEWAAEEWAD
jgi:hypothetical protein